VARVRSFARRLLNSPVPVVALVACAGQAPAGDAARVDDWGRTLALAAPARRIVSLSPSTTEIVFALGLGGRLVGRTTWCDYPAAARAVPDVGNGMEPNVEAVAARRPDLVLLYASPANRPAADRLASLGIAVAGLTLDRAVDVRRAARLIGALAGASRAADSLVAAFDSSLSAARAFAAPGAAGPRLRLYVHVWADPPVTVGRGSYLDEILRFAGADNVFGDLAASSATVSLESVVSRDPDGIVVLAGDTSAGPPDLSARAAWRAVRAVREGRYLVLDGSLYGRPSPRVPLAVRDLSGRLLRLAAR